MRYVMAVSGGVDSVVLLHMLVSAWKKTAEGTSAVRELQGEERVSELISESLVEELTPPFVIAHFDHGIRSDSADDARFVAALAAMYGVPFEMQREELGADASEELARNRRYAFLRQVAQKYDAIIVTAHHMNDVAETIAINVERGTGWRGVAVLDSDVVRPLLGMTKQEILAYALSHNLEWREDSTNTSDKYLRNRLRAKVGNEQLVRSLARLHEKQIEIKRHIDQEVTQVIGISPYSRYFLTYLDTVSAMECLRVMTKARLTRPQMGRLLLAIKTQKAGAQYQAGAGITVCFTARDFSLSILP